MRIIAGVYHGSRNDQGGHALRMAALMRLEDTRAA